MIWELMRVLSRVITSDSAYIYDLLNIGGRPCSAVKTKSLAETVNYLGQFFLRFFYFLKKWPLIGAIQTPGSLQRTYQICLTLWGRKLLQFKGKDDIRKTLQKIEMENQYCDSFHLTGLGEAEKVSNARPEKLQLIGIFKGDKSQKILLMDIFIPEIGIF